MKSPEITLEKGLSVKKEFTVGEKDTAKYYGSGKAIFWRHRHWCALWKLQPRKSSTVAFLTTGSRSVPSSAWSIILLPLQGWMSKSMSLLPMLRARIYRLKSAHSTVLAGLPQESTGALWRKLPHSKDFSKRKAGDSCRIFRWLQTKITVKSLLFCLCRKVDIKNLILTEVMVSWKLFSHNNRAIRQIGYESHNFFAAKLVRVHSPE